MCPTIYLSTHLFILINKILSINQIPQLSGLNNLCKIDLSWTAYFFHYIVLLLYYRKTEIRQIDRKIHRKTERYAFQIDRQIDICGR